MLFKDSIRRSDLLHDYIFWLLKQPDWRNQNSGKCV